MSNRPVIEILDTFKYSVNIQDDYLKTEKLNSYIPTYDSVNLLIKYLHSIESQNNKSFLLSGAYGTGKSFLMSVMLGFASGKIKETQLKVLLKKIDSCGGNINVSEFKEILRQQKNLIVFPKDIFSDFSQAIAMGINESIEYHNLTASLNSSFISALVKIDSWKEKYSYFYKELCEELETRNTNIKSFTTALSIYSEKAYTQFEEIYPKIMGGDMFIPVNSSRSVIEIMKEFEGVAKQNGYTGVIYVFDEFGRYLEQNITNIDVKQVQDAAEFCNSGGDSSLFLITHKDIFQYSRKISASSESRNEWEKVSGRFSKEHLSYAEENTHHLISQVLSKTTAFKDLYSQNKKFTSSVDQLETIQVANAEQMVMDLYPLNYISAKLLPELSQKLAQNERTLFSFLCGDEELALKNIFTNSSANVQFISPDLLYDYFEENFKFLGYESKEYRCYLNAKNILAYITNKEEKRFIKTLAIFYIVNNFKEIKPNKEFLETALNLSQTELDQVIEALSSSDHISYRRHSKSYILTQELDVNIDKLVQDYIIDHLSNDYDYISTLSEALPPGYELPVKYNDEFKITRYLKKYYLDVSRFSDKVFTKILKNKIEDGKIIYLFNLRQIEFDYSALVSQYGSGVIFIQPIKEVEKLIQELKELEAINRLFNKDEISSKEVVRTELLQFKLELIEVIESKITGVYSNYNNLNVFVETQKIESVSNCDQFQNELRLYLKEKYSQYVKVNYELINKTKLTPAMKKCRRTIQSKIRNGELCRDFFYATAADSSVARILLNNTNLFKDGKISFTESTFGNLFTSFIQFIEDKPRTFAEVYEEYASNQSNWGFRKGLLTFLISIITEQLSDEISISHNGDEVDISPDVYDQIEIKESEYSISYVKLSTDKRQFLKELHQRVRKSVDSKLFEKNQSLAVYNGLKLYLYSLPILAQQKVKIVNREVRKIFENSSIRNSKEFFFIKLPSIYKQSEDFNYISQRLLSDLDLLDLECEKLEFRLLEVVLDILNVEATTISEAIQKWEVLQDKNTSSRFSSWVESIKPKIFSNDNQGIMISLTELVSGFDYYNWRSDNDISEFTAKFKGILNESSCKLGNKDLFSEIKNIKLSPMAKMLKGKLEADIKNMGRSVPVEEMKSIIHIILTAL